MKSTKGIVCRECRGQNKPGSRYCWFCGAPLPRLGRGPSGNWTTVGIILQVVRWLTAIAVVLAVVAGLYYAVDHYLLPLFQKDETPTTVVVVTSTSTTRSTTTTTTLPPRDDHVVKAGDDRYATAIAISKLGFPGGSPALVLVNGEDFSEALSVTPLAAAYDGPVLLLPPEGVRDDLATEIRRLSPSRIFLVGVSKPKTVTTQLREIVEQLEVTSLAGNDAYEIAALVATEIQTKLETISKVVIAPANSFIEAIAVAPLAAAKGWPILLAAEDGTLPRATRNAIKSLEVDAALVVAAGVEMTLTDVETKTGANGYETAAFIAEYAASQGMTFKHTAVATGDAFPDGLVAGSYLALDKGMLLLTKSGRLPTAALSLFTDNEKTIRRLDFIALPELAQSLARTAGGAGSPGAGSSTTLTTD